MKSAFRFSVNGDGIASLVFDLPNEKVNTFSMPVMQELETIIDNAAQNRDIKIMSISSAKDGVFIAGADLHSFEPMTSDGKSVQDMIDTGHRTFDKLANLPFPTVALIDGACLGGGMELCLACTYRVVSDSPKTILGLPEVSLGIIPGWGGTQRLPRLIGLEEALGSILKGKPTKAYRAWKIKMADAIFPTEFFENKAQDFLKYCLTKEGKKNIYKRRKLSGLKYQLLENNPIGRYFLFKKVKKDVLKKTRGHYPSAIIALDLVENTCSLPLQEGLVKESKAFKDNVKTGFANAKNLIELFFLQEALKKESWVPADIKPMKISNAGVVGAGTMGSGIAWLLTNRDFSVRLKEVNWQAIANGFRSVNDIYIKLSKEGKIKPIEASLKMHRLTGSVDYSGFQHMDFVIEAALENLTLKHQILTDLENVVDPACVIASNTSSLTITEMGKVMKHPERFVGMHFFNPANKMPLVEVIASDKTSPQTIATAIDLCRKLGKTPIVVRDCPGFLINRVFIVSDNEILNMYVEGASVKELEQAMFDFGMPMSPFALADEVGNDIGYKVSQVFELAYGSRMPIPALLKAMNDRKLYGKKCGQGFYLYSGKKMTFNPEVEKLRKELSIRCKSFTQQEIIDRVFLLMINESARCLEEKIVANAKYLDMAFILGVGFPPFRGGLLRYADTLGIDYIVNQLKRYQSIYGERFAPCNFLLEKQKNRQTFY